MSNLRVLLTGATGYLGHHLLAALRALGCEVVTGGRTGADVPLDLADPAGCASAVRRAAPDRVLNAGAMSSIVGCEQDPERATNCNATAVGALAASGAKLVQVSTDLVFDGAAAPYAHGDVARPLSVYGLSKAGGEAAALAAGGMVVRVPLLLGPSFDGRRGATDMLRSAAAEGRALSLFTNEFRTPLHVADAARTLAGCVLEPTIGIVHAAGPERVSRFELAQRFARVHGFDASLWTAVEAIDPRRPRDVSLVSDLAAARTLDAMLVDA